MASAHSHAAMSPASSVPQGTFLPGTKVQVGSQRVIIEKYLSEGGFAHVYIVRIPRENHKHELAVLKRVAVPDKSHLANMRTEVETMKKLTGHKHVVTYKDSHASQLKGGGYEVFLLMEYCNGGGLIDFMNTRLQHRLTEPEILKIFGDVAEGVACMHYLKPPLLHRDLKVENVLISTSSGNGVPVYKLCDFGSAAAPRPAAKTAEEARLIEDDVQQHTTMQYRSPEMIDVWRKQPIDEKSDIWALGVLLYKLCYYTTPFEDVGQMAILNATFKYPSHPPFSSKVKQLIGSMLRENPQDRPNIYQVVKAVCDMRGTPVPIKDIYTNRTQSETRRNEQLPTEPAIGLQKQTPQTQVVHIPDIAPMRRGRPTTQQPSVVKSTAVHGDPFAALDSKDYSVRSNAVDELSKRFPALDDFTLAHNTQTPQKQNTKPVAKEANKSKQEHLNERVTNTLADEVFGQKSVTSEIPKIPSANLPRRPMTTAVDSSELRHGNSNLSNVRANVRRPPSPRSGVKYADTGVGSSPPTSSVNKYQFPEINSRPVWKVPTKPRSSSQPRHLDDAQKTKSSSQPGESTTQRSSLLSIQHSNSYPKQNVTATSSRPSLEGTRPSATELETAPLSRARSTQERQRPSSAYVASNLEFLRNKESTRKQSSRRHSRTPSNNPEFGPPEDTNIVSDIDYLRSSESNELPARSSSSSKPIAHKKRSSLSNAKQIFSGRLGDRFKRFESNGTEGDRSDMGLITQDPPSDADEAYPIMLSPIQGSDAGLVGHSDHNSVIDETEDLAPEIRRELERRKLADEEKRVALAAAEYRVRVNNPRFANNPAPTQANIIQERVHSLLNEGRESPKPIKRTAEGYGRYTDQPAVESRDMESVPSVDANTPSVKKTSLPAAELSSPKVAQQAAAPARTDRPAETGIVTQQGRTMSRPSVPPKAPALQTGTHSRPSTASPAMAETGQIPVGIKPKGGLAALLAKDLEGVPDYPPRVSSVAEAAAPSMVATTDAYVPTYHDADKEDLQADFSKRYPSLAGLELVETEIGDRQRLHMRET